MSSEEILHWGEDVLIHLNHEKPEVHAALVLLFNDIRIRLTTDPWLN